MKKYRCSVCKGTNVQIRAWVDANTHKYDSDIPSEDAWCEDCDDHVSLEEVEYGRYVVIDDFNGYINLVLDKNGNTKVFNTLQDALNEAKKCQNGMVVKLKG